ncbi:MAG TPA: phosphoglycerate mutase family protein [Pirellulaceae bacterium]|nr:phosphoglycerate mutase family protein [Pirellulaceae bacterium]
MDQSPVRFRRWPYFVWPIVPLIVFCIGWWWFCWGPATTVLLVRHADRDPGQDVLNPAGVDRAQELVHVLERAGISTIYHSDAARTRLTAEPLAAALGLTPVEIPAADRAALVSAIRAHPGETVLVVGHSDTLPQIISELGGPTITVPGNEFDNLFVLTRCRWRGFRLVNLQYGAASP